VAKISLQNRLAARLCLNGLSRATCVLPKQRTSGRRRGKDMPHFGKFIPEVTHCVTFSIKLPFGEDMPHFAKRSATATITDV
jgi:hypothetical protein